MSIHKAIKTINRRDGIITNNSLEGELLQDKIMRITTMNEPITDGAPELYFERKHGVIPETNIRTDKWDRAIEMTDVASRTHVAKRQEALKIDIKTGEQVGGESTGTGGE